MFIYAIDPGPTRSALVIIEGDRLTNFADMAIEEVCIIDTPQLIERVRIAALGGTRTRLVVEMIASYGMPVGAEVFETCVTIGRIIEAWKGDPVIRITRNQVKQAICHSSRANDSNIRQAIIDRFGGKDVAIGSKKAPGPLYGVHNDMWAAIAVGLTYLDSLNCTS